MLFETATQKNIDAWLHGQYDEKTKKELQRLLKEDPEKIKNSFFKKLSFGTGGAREIMGIGTNRLNIYTVRALTLALAKHLQKSFAKQKIKVFIGFDTRNNSHSFAKEAALTLAANEIEVFLFQEPRPTPLVSFGCRFKKCHAAIMITASHNPPEYNGYKVYWQDGAQILSPHDKKILSELDLIEDLASIKTAKPESPLVHPVLEEIDNAYLKQLKTINNYPEISKKEGKKLKILYTNLHGTGITILPKALKQEGFTNFTLVEKQTSLDGNFPFAPQPNPEEKKALELGIEQMQKEKIDLFLATDPDADRIAVVALHQNQPVIFSGNQIAALLLNHILKTLTSQKKLPSNSYCVKSIVTTELFPAIAKNFKIENFNVLTGFKYIAEKIAHLESFKNFLFGAEESLGYLYKDFVRDKDSISAAFLISEMALLAKLKGKTLKDLLFTLYQTYGLFREKLISLKFQEGQKGLLQMQKLLENLRAKPPKKINQVPVAIIEDYLTLQAKNLKTGQTSPITLPKSDVLAFWLEDKTKIIIRPSGTEPKVKIYLGVQKETKTENIEKTIFQADEQLSQIEKELKTLIS